MFYLLSVSARGTSCKFCGKSFSRGFNLRRHEIEYCPLLEQNSDTSSTESDIDYRSQMNKKRKYTESDDVVSTTSDDDLQSSAASDKKRKYSESDDVVSTASENDLQSSEASESGSEIEDNGDPWKELKIQAIERNATRYDELKQNFLENGLDDETAKEKVYTVLLPKFQKSLRNIYLERLLWMRQLKRDPIHRKIMETRDTFVNSEDFGPKEALEAAVDKRKFLMKHLFRQVTIPKEDEYSD